MRPLPFAVLAGLILTAAAPAPARQPVVVELFQSQGCSSCPPALANVNALADRADVLPLTFAVTYWDRLGWKDSFAQPAFTQRQWDYAHAAGRPQVATPQTIIDGRVAINGGNRAELLRTIAAAAHDGGPSIAAKDGRVTVGAARTAAPATVWMVEFDPRTLRVPIRAGENGGKTLAHRNVGRLLSPLGSWTGAAASYPVPTRFAPDPNRRLAVLVQRGTGGPIVAAARF